MTNIAILGGAGTIGATTAYTLAAREPALNISLVDPEIDSATGHALDSESMAGHASHAVGKETMCNPADAGGGSVTAMPDLSAVVREGFVPDLIVMAASDPRPPGTDERGARSAQLDSNLALTTDIAESLNDLAIDPVAVIVVTNPTDRITYRLWEQTSADWDRDRFVGYSLSETARFARSLATRFDVQPSEVYSPVMGEHGEGVVPVFSKTTISGEAVSLGKAARATIRDEIRDIVYEVIQLRGASESSRWVSSYGVALLARAMIRDDVNEPVCLSTVLDGEYGYTGAALSVPVLLSSSGIEQRVIWELAEEEREQFEAAYNAVSADIARWEPGRS